MATVDDLYEGLQLFREYVEANMPYKQTVYFGTIDPSVTPQAANLGAFYFQTNNINPPTEILNVFYKVNVGNTDWALFGEGGGSNVTASANTAGLGVVRTGSSTFALNLTLLNFDGTPLNLNNPLVLPYRNITDTSASATFSLISFTQERTLLLNASTNLGLPENTPSKVFVYLGISVADPSDRRLCVSGAHRKNTDKPLQVLDFNNGSPLSSAIYTDFQNPVGVGSYNLRLISVIDITFSSSSGWGVPANVTPYSPEFDYLDDKLFLVNTAPAISLRQQISELGSPTTTLKDFQRLYNNLCLQTYNEQNNINIFSISSNTVLAITPMLRNYAIRVNPLNAGLTLTIPSIAGSKSLFVSNSSETNTFTISYLGETLEIGLNETRHLNFCGTSDQTTPAIRLLDNRLIKPIPDYFGIKAENNLDDSSIILTLCHPNGADLSATNYINVDVQVIDDRDSTTPISAVSSYKVTQNIELEIPWTATLGLTTDSPNNPESIYLYYYSDGFTQGLAVSGVSKLQSSKTYNIAQLQSNSSTKSVLYSSTLVNDASIKPVGFISGANLSPFIFSGISVGADRSVDELLTGMEPSQSTTFKPVLESDTTFEGIKKLTDTDSWLNIRATTAQTTINTQIATVIELDETTLHNTTHYIQLEPDLNLSTDQYSNVARRYCIADFATPTKLDAYCIGALFVVEVVDAPITITAVQSGVPYNEISLEGNGKKYLIWIAPASDLATLGSNDKIRIVCEYPTTIAASNIKSFKTVDTSTVFYNAAVNDAFILGNTTNSFTFNLPNGVANGSKVYFYFAAVDTSYTQNYSINVSSPSAYYQTTDTTITVNNGGFCLEFEYNLLNDDPYWFITSTDYNHVDVIPVPENLFGTLNYIGKYETSGISEITGESLNAIAPVLNPVTSDLDIYQRYRLLDTDGTTEFTNFTVNAIDIDYAICLESTDVSDPRLAITPFNLNETLNTQTDWQTLNSLVLGVGYEVVSVDSDTIARDILMLEPRKFIVIPEIKSPRPNLTAFDITLVNYTSPTDITDSLVSIDLSDHALMDYTINDSQYIEFSYDISTKECIAMVRLTETIPATSAYAYFSIDIDTLAVTLLEVKTSYNPSVIDVTSAGLTTLTYYQSSDFYLSVNAAYNGYLFGTQSNHYGEFIQYREYDSVDTTLVSNSLEDIYLNLSAWTSLEANDVINAKLVDLGYVPSNPDFSPIWGAAGIYVS